MSHSIKSVQARLCSRERQRGSSAYLRRIERNVFSFDDSSAFSGVADADDIAEPARREMAHLSEGGIRVPSMNNAHRARPEGLPQVRYRQDFNSEAIAGAWEKDIRRRPKQGGGVKQLPWQAVSARGPGANPIR